jgi:hypothetical protein
MFYASTVYNVRAGNSSSLAIFHQNRARHSSGTRKPVITDPYQFYFPNRNVDPAEQPPQAEASAETAG